MAMPLLNYINSRIHDKEVSKEIVQEIFVSLWNKRDHLTIESSFESYLYGAAKFQVLNYIRSEKVRKKYAEHFALYAYQLKDHTIDEDLNLLDLKEVINDYLQQLPAKCQKVFKLSRFDHKTIDEIAIEMGISTRTVENYISQALKHLRHQLVDYPWVLVFLLLYPL